jgi:hypothetical protein
MRGGEEERGVGEYRRVGVRDETEAGGEREKEKAVGKGGVMRWGRRVTEGRCEGGNVERYVER